MVVAPQSGPTGYHSTNRSSTTSRSYVSLNGIPASPASTAGRSNNPFVDPANDTSGTTTPAGAPVAPVTTAALTELEKAPQPDSPVPPFNPPFYKRRRFIITSVIGACLGIALLFIMLFPVVKAIIQDIVNKATIDVTMAAISNPTNTSFQLTMQGTVAHTSTISATISFPNPINVSWMDNSTKVPVGYIQLSALHTSNNRATINETTTFYITDQNAFGRFASATTTSQNATWQLESYDLSVQAEKFPVAHGISFNKMVTINGINNFAGNVQLDDLQLPSGNIVDGMNFVTVIQLNNPSPFELDVGTVVVDLSYQGVYLGNGTCLNTRLSLGNNSITSSGTFIPQTTLSNIAVVSQLVTNYVSHKTSLILATGKSAIQSDGTTISWLSQSVENLALTIPLLSTTPIDPLGLMNLSLALTSLPDTVESPDRQ